MLSWLLAMWNTVTTVEELFLFVSSTIDIIFINYSVQIYSLFSINQVACQGFFPHTSHKEKHLSPPYIQFPK